MEDRVRSISDSVDVLKGTPSADDVLRIIHGLSTISSTCVPSAESAQVMAVLLNKIVPDFYDALKQHKEISHDLLILLRSLTGIRALLNVVLMLTDIIRRQPNDSQARSKLQVLLTILGDVLSANILVTLYNHIKSHSKKDLYWREITALFASGKVTAVVAEAKAAIDANDKPESWWWIADGAKMMEFLGSEMLACGDGPVDDTILAKFCYRGLSSGYPNQFLHQLLNKKGFDLMKRISRHLDSREATSFTKALIRYLQTTYFDREDADAVITSHKISSAATVLMQLIPLDEEITILDLVLQQQVGNQRLRRTVVAWIVFHGLQEQVFDDLLKMWGDKVVIRNAQITKQEVQTEILGLLLPHLGSKYVRTVAQSKQYLTGVSNRLSAASTHLRYMGMCLAVAVNERDNSGIKLGFDDVLGFSAVYGEWSKLLQYKGAVMDETSMWEYLEARGSEPVLQISPVSKIVRVPISSTKMGKQPAAAPIDINVEKDSDDETDSEFEPYAILEDESEDSDDDPTMRREKVLPPVYIIDLIKYFHETESNTALLKHKVALANAAKVILRKAMFGRELETVSKELGIILSGIKNNYNLDDFEQDKMNAMVALVVSVPEVIGPLYAESVTFGDYSMQERLTMLSALALGTLHLSGIQSYDFGIDSESVFTSKLLPAGIHERFISAGDYPHGLARLGLLQFDDAINMIQKDTLQESITKATESVVKEPGVLRISKRLQNERQRAAGKISVQPNNVAKIAGKSFFFPLAAHWRYFSISSSRNEFGVVMAGHYIKTLAIILRASYPLSTDILDMSMELFSILSSIRRDVAEASIMESFLTAVLVVIDVNEEDTVISTFAKQLIEIKEYLDANWDRVTDQRVHSMAAGVLIKITQLLQTYHRRLVGEYLTMGS
ncbi:telomere length regulation protein-domain-containing protein [Lipomyces orientalis]|uniref:Telomere length regulation protein-domain-containing protein n=1 Tax=Lipomyces orientalis TaxID=1233043 RepID=A0ACC3THE7_9ASCO